MFKFLKFYIVYDKLTLEICYKACYIESCWGEDISYYRM